MRDAVERAFTPSRGSRRIGAELELFVLAGRLGVGEELAARGCPSYEPGGQLELSVPAQPSVQALVRELEWCLHEVSSCCRIALRGTDPVRELDDASLVLATPRYLAMQRLFDRTGPDGRRMMRLTASLQVSLDLLPGEAGREQWLVANLAGPALVAAYGGSRARTRIWQGIDPVRTGYDGRQLDPADPVGAYTGFASAAPRLPIPDAEDDAYHLSTLFPPVRPRGGYLELRYLDSQQPTTELLGTVWTLLYDDQARREALELLVPTLSDYWGQWQSADPADLLSIAAPRGVAA